MAEYIPTTDEVRAMYVTGTPPHRVSVTQGNAEFDAWLAEHDREVQARALEEAADVFEWARDDVDYAAFQGWLRDRAIEMRAARLRTPDVGVGGGERG